MYGSPLALMACGHNDAYDMVDEASDLSTRNVTPWPTRIPSRAQHNTNPQISVHPGLAKLLAK